MELCNNTDLNVMSFEQIDKQRRDCVVVVAAASYDISASGDVRASTGTYPIELTDSYYGDPRTSSIRLPTQLAYCKRRTDIFFIDPVAYSPGNTPHREWPVSIQVGKLGLVFMATGPRQWRKGVFGSWELTPPAPCLSVDVRFENAFGGSGLPQHDGRAAEPFIANPVGLGWVSTDELKARKTIEAPRLYAPADPPTRPNRPCEVVGITPVAPSWSERLCNAGTYDAEWLQNDWPYLPTDFSEDFFNVAPFRLQYPGFLTGAEGVQIVGLSSRGTVRFQLPSIPVFQLSAFCMDGTSFQIPLRVDTLALDLNEHRFGLIWRGVFSPKAPVFYSQLRHLE